MDNMRTDLRHKNLVTMLDYVIHCKRRDPESSVWGDITRLVAANLFVDHALGKVALNDILSIIDGDFQGLFTYGDVLIDFIDKDSFDIINLTDFITDIMVLNSPFYAEFIETLYLSIDRNLTNHEFLITAWLRDKFISFRYFTNPVTKDRHYDTMVNLLDISRRVIEYLPNLCSGYDDFKQLKFKCISIDD